MRRLTFTLAASGLLCPLALFAQNLDWKAAASYTKSPAKEALSTRLTDYTEQDTNTANNQQKFAKNLVKELRSYGWSATQEKNGLVWLTIPTNVKADIPEVLFVARTDDTATHVVAQLHKNYKGGEVTIQQDPRVALDTYNSPQLTRAYGHDLMTASGKSALGAGTKSGVAIAMQIAQFLDKYPALSHGPVALAFAPGEEALKTLAAKKANTPYVYTLEGTERGEITDQIFTVKRFFISFDGNRRIPVGQANNSAFTDNLLIASDFHSLLPRANRPETTSGERGFIYVDKIAHQADHTDISGVVQAFSKQEVDRLSAEVTRAFNTTKAMYNKATNFSLTWKEEQKNIHDVLPQPPLLLAEQAMRTEEITPKRTAARTQTTSAFLTANGLPAYALFTGHYNDHTDREYADIDEMEDALRTAMQLLSSLTVHEMSK